MRLLGLLPLLALVVVASACNAVLGNDEHQIAASAGGVGSVGSAGVGAGIGGQDGSLQAGGGGAAEDASTGAGGTMGGSTGSGGNDSCAPEQSMSCLNNTTPKKCVGGTWQPQPACAGDTPACAGEGTCICTPESSMSCLDGTTPKKCVGGVWQGQAACTGETLACSGGACVCSSEQKRCATGTQPQTCSGGAYVNAAPCGGAAPLCSGGTCVPESCSGCARLSGPFAATDEGVNMCFSYSPAIDLTGTTITAHVFVLAGTNLFMYLGGLDPAYKWCGGPWDVVNSSGKWQDVSYAVNATNCTGGFDTTKVFLLCLYVAEVPPGPWTNPTVVYVDSLTVRKGATDVVGPYTFDTGLQGSALATAPVSLPGATLTWLGP